MDKYKVVVDVKLLKRKRFIITKRDGDYVACIFDPNKSRHHLPIALFYVSNKSRNIAKGLFPSGVYHRFFISFDTNGMDNFNGRFVRHSNA